jgi:hypothetical protein
VAFLISSEQLYDFTHQRETRCLLAVPPAAQHRPRRLLVEQFGEALGLVAVNGDFRITPQMRNAHFFQNAFGQFRKWNGDENVELCLANDILLLAVNGYDPAGVDVQTDRRS